MDRAELRHAAYRRLRWVRLLLRWPWVRRTLKFAGVLIMVAYFGFVSLILGLRYWGLPQVATHQAEIEQAVAKAVGMPVRIERIDADWSGLNPRLTLSGVRILDSEGRQALAFNTVESVLSWRSLWHFSPIMHLLAIDGPVLHVRRDTQGRITVAGVNTEGETDPRAMEMLLQQRHIRIRNATVVWEDALRKAPPLVLEDLQFGLDNSGRRHRFGLSALPPERLASRIDLRGEVKGDLLGDVHQLVGRVYAELDYADLAGWRAWVDYPFAMQQGRGAIRMWGDWDEGRGGVTTDLALEDVMVKLGRNLPELKLANLRGRLQGRYRANDWMLSGQKLELSTLEGLRIAPTDFSVNWRENPSVAGVAGEASASNLDLDALTQLALYLPLDQRSRDLLAIHQPRGHIADLRTTWDAREERLQHYTLRGHFDSLGLNADGVLPGAQGWSGDVDASEKGGVIELRAKDGGVDLPAIFPESKIPLDALQAKANWKVDGAKVDVHLERLEFSSPDATGAARGSYLYTGQGPGVIDLTATISRADGKAVWRYMPRVINQETRDWLKQGIVSGTASDAKLTLRGDLRDFPYRDRSKGIFLITAKAKGVRLNYGDGWPVLDGVDADMRYGVGMHIDATAGSILGTKILRASAQIPDFDVPEEQLIVQGSVEGPTSAFLRFIDESPVANSIDRFTEDMRAQGNGRLDLKLDMPLRHVVDTKINGNFHFLSNQVTVAPGMPPITQVNGQLNFTENSITAREVNGFVLGAPMRLSAKNEGQRVQVALSGGATAKELRKFLGSPVLDYLAGATTWKGEVQVKKKTAEFVIESNLQGLSSALPEPFSKAATTAMPFRLEKGALPRTPDGKERDQLRMSLRGLAEAQLQRRETPGGSVIERGAFGVGTTMPALPANGLVGDVNLPRVDADFWRKALSGDGSAGAGEATEAPLAVTRLTLRTPQLRLLNRDFNAVEATASTRDKGWQVAINAKELAGDLFWQGADKGSVSADLKRLAVPPEAVSATVGASEITEIPALDVRVADFTLGDKRLGHLEVKARNIATGWQLDSLVLQNPDGNLKGQGEWRLRGAQQTRLSFELNATDAGKLLERLGYVGAMRRGTAKLSGKLAWDGPLTGIHYPTLTGDMLVRADKGQFAKLEPGIGKLLGLISLSSLPRRLTLDFRDIFSEGLAFDTIDGKLLIKQGIMRTDEELKIDGPAAAIVIRGEADLKKETQDLNVRVQPELGGIATIGAAALAHPAIGAAAWVVNKLLQNPLNKIFAFQYHVTGTWDDPKVEKLGQPAVEEKPSEKPADKAPEKKSEVQPAEKSTT